MMHIELRNIKLHSLIIRKAACKDTAKLAILFDNYRQFYEQIPNIKLATQFIEDRLQKQDSYIFLAENSQKEIIGFCQLYPTFCSVKAAPICVLYDLFIDLSARKVGAGKALMLAAQTYAKDNGFVRLDLTTAITNTSAQSLYESLGWMRDNEFYTYNKEISN
jgi:ribosomal protein S18 acetylase RimI-like enzyme